MYRKLERRQAATHHHQDQSPVSFFLPSSFFFLSLTIIIIGHISMKAQHVAQRRVTLTYHHLHPILTYRESATMTTRLVRVFLFIFFSFSRY
jgi:hypothetical protein